MVADLRGWNKWTADLKLVGKELDKQITEANRAVAKKVLPKARQAMASQPHRGAVKAAGLVKATAGKRWAGIRVTPSAEVPYTAALEFGRNIHNVFGRIVSAESMARRVFLPHSGDGHAIRPLVKQMSESGQLDREYAVVVEDCFKKHGWR